MSIIVKGFNIKIYRIFPKVFAYNVIVPFNRDNHGIYVYVTAKPRNKKSVTLTLNIYVLCPV